MSSGARLARIERSLGPRVAVVAWLVEARSQRSLAAYGASLVDVPGRSMPLETLLQRVRRGAAMAHRGASSATVTAAEASAAEEAVTGYELVVALNLDVGVLIERTRRHLDLLRITKEIVGFSNAKDRPGRSSPPSSPAGNVERRDRWAEAVHDLQDELETEDEARAILERRYLDGHGALFDEVNRQWRSLVRDVGELAAVAGRKCVSTARTPSGIDTSATLESAPHRPTAEARARSIEDEARLRALELLGAQHRVDQLVHARLRAHRGTASKGVQIRSLERVARPNSRRPPVALSDHPADHLTPQETADGYRRLADLIEQLAADADEATS